MDNEKETTGSNDVNSLVEQLRQETENAHNTHSGQEPIEVTTFEEPVDQPEPELAGGEPPEEISEKIKKSALRYVKMFNSIMKIIFKPLYKKTILEEGDVEKMQAFQNKNRGKSGAQMEEALHSDDKMWPVANRFDKFMKAVDEIPLDKDEMEMLAEPLSEVINKYKRSQLSPEWSLAIAAAVIMLPRMVPMMPDVSKMFKDGES